MEKTNKPIEVIVDPVEDMEVEEQEQTAYIKHMATKPWLFQPGNNANPSGRPKGKTLKEWVRDYLAGLTDAERIEYMRGIPKVDLWKMAEGNPTEDKNIKVTVPTPILGGVSQDIQQIQGEVVQEVLSDGKNEA